MRSEAQNKPQVENKRLFVLIAAAAALLIAALVWRIALESGSLSSKIIGELRNKGCFISADTLYQHEFKRNTSISALLEGEDLAPAVAVSKQAGFPSDTEKIGDVYCLLAELDGGAVLTVFVVDEQIELAFIQTPGNDSLLPVSGTNNGN